MLFAEHCSHTFFLGVILVLSLFSCRTLAATEFQWAFPHDVTISHQLQECSTLQIGLILSSGYQPVPPLYLIGYPENGIPVASALQGSGSYSWQVPFPAGTTLLMQVIDSEGVTGGVSTDVYTVMESPFTTCHSDMNSSQVKLAVNTEQLSTCDQVVLDVSGGTAPYTLTIVAQSIIPVNRTLPQAGRLQWVNNLDPVRSPLIIAAVSDAHGNYAPSSGFANLSKDGNIQCSGTTLSFAPLSSSTPNPFPIVVPPLNITGISSGLPSTSTFKSQSLEEPTTGASQVFSGSTAFSTNYAPTHTAKAISSIANVTSKLRIALPASAVACLLLMGIAILCVRRRRASSDNKKAIRPRPFVRALSAFNLPRESFIQREPSVIQAILPQTQKRETARFPSQQTRDNSSGLDDLVIVLRRCLRTVRSPEPVEALRKTSQGYNRIPETASISTTASRAILEAVPTWDRCDSASLQCIVTVPQPVAINRASRTLSPRVSESLPDYDTSCAS